MKTVNKSVNGKLYKLRCRKNGILVTNRVEKYDVVWVREFVPHLGMGVDHLKEWESNKRIFIHA